MRDLRRSSNTVDKAAAKRAVWWGRPPPEPGLGLAVELSSGGGGDVRDVAGVGVGHRHRGEGCAPEPSPPTFDEVQPRRPDGNEGVLDARVVRQPPIRNPGKRRDRLVLRSSTAVWIVRERARERRCSMPKLLQARPPLDAREEHQVRKLATS